jgi:hypothetical protein
MRRRIGAKWVPFFGWTRFFSSADSAKITVTVLEIEEVHRVGKVVHLRIDKIPHQSCGDIHRRKISIARFAPDKRRSKNASL